MKSNLPKLNFNTEECYVLCVVKFVVVTMLKLHAWSQHQVTIILSSKRSVVKSKTLCKIKLLCETIKHYCKGILCILLGAKVA